MIQPKRDQFRKCFMPQKMLPYERRRAKPRGLLIVAGAETR
jgi:hypothetical protein